MEGLEELCNEEKIFVVVVTSDQNRIEKDWVNRAGQLRNLKKIELTIY